MAHLFGGPDFVPDEIRGYIEKNETVTPEILLDCDFRDPDNPADYADIAAGLKHHKARGRFCYLQANGIFEALNAVFGIENHLLYMALYPDELKAVYRKLAEWNRRFAENAMDLGVDMIHVSDDWGSQQSLLFSPAMFREMIVPNHRITAEAVKKRGRFLSLHSDGFIVPALDAVCELGYDVVHPWQESAGMSYDLYEERYADRFAIMGGVCVQTALGFGDSDRLEREIRRVFSRLKGKRWICCTTHFVQSHCSLDELIFAFDLIRKLARE